MGRINVLLDTNVLSLAFRRKPHQLNPAETQIARQVLRLAVSGAGGIIGPVRQEFLTGIRDAAKFDSLCELLGSYPDVRLLIPDYESAARMTNQLRANGTTVTSIDALLAASALNRDLTVFSQDTDMKHFLVFGLKLV